MEKNLTNGSVLKNIITFSIPFLFSYFLQTLYSLADLYIIGQYAGTDATTAVSIGGQVMHMVTVMIVGLAMGGTVFIGRAVGSQNKELRNVAVGNMTGLFAIVSVAVTIVLLLCSKLVVQGMSTPVEAATGTWHYLIICFAGIPFITAYNVISSMFRGMGDSKSPMYFIAVACGCNIAFDYLFIGYCNMGPVGAALGTTLAQTISVAVSLFAIVRRKMIDGLCKSDFIFRKEVVGKIFSVGLPISFQDGFIQIAFLLITVFANKRGLNDAAAVGIVEKLIGILFLVPSSLLQSVSALAAQNIGAGKYIRAKKTLWYSAAIAAGCGFVFSVVFQFIAGDAVGLFTDDAEVIIRGTQYMKSYVWDCMLAGVHFTFSGYFSACNHSGLSFLHNILSIVLARIPISYYASITYMDSLYPMGVAAPIGSLLSVIICVIAYMVIRKENEDSE